MKRTCTRVLRSALSLVLVFCLTLSLCGAAFANESTEEKTINYVSLGDSMTNGLGLGNGYDGTGHNGYNEICTLAYPHLVATHYEPNWELTQLATSAMRAEDLHYILEVGKDDAYAGDQWTENELMGHSSRWKNTDAATKFQDAITKADVVSMAVGNANFGVYLMDMITSTIGLPGYGISYDYCTLDNALDMLKADEETKAIVKSIYAKVLDYVDDYLPTEMADTLANRIAYVVTSYMINFEGALDRIVELNPDVEIIIVGLMNTMSGYELNITAENGTTHLDMAALLDIILNPMNAYLAGLPTVKQELGQYAEAKLYYAELDRIETHSKTFKEVYQDEENDIRDRFIGTIVGSEKNPGLVWSLIGQQTFITVNDVVDYEAAVLYKTVEDEEVALTEEEQIAAILKYMQQNAAEDGFAEKVIAVVTYLTFENAILDALEQDADVNLAEIAMPEGDFDLMSLIAANMEPALKDTSIVGPACNEKYDVIVETLAVSVLGANEQNKETLINSIKEATESDEMFYGLKTLAESAANALVQPVAMAETLNNHGLISALLSLYGRLQLANGMAAHPNANDHVNMANEIIAAYGNHTVKDETIENVEVALDALYNVLVTYGPEVAAEVWNQWVEYGYVEAVETSMAELGAMLTARYEYYTETALPAIEAAVGELAAQKDALCAELDVLKAELEAKKAELEKVISEQEIGSIHMPEITIDVQLGNNEQTEVPERECVVESVSIEAELEAAIADLEHAIAVIEALITDIAADIADMVALAEQIAAAVAELEKTMTDIAAAAEDLAAAVEAAIAVLQDNEGVINAVVKSFDAARATVLAANDVLDLTLGVAEEIIADIDTMVEKIAVDAEALYNKFITDLPGCIEQIPEEVQQIIGGAIYLTQMGLEEGKKLLEKKLKEELAELEAYYYENEDEINAEIEKIKGEYETAKKEVQDELDAIYAEIKAEAKAQYAAIEEQLKADIAALEAEAEAQIKALEAELAGYKAELESAAEDAIEGIQAQIDRVTGDIATVNEDLACAIEHLEAAAEIAYEEIVAEVTAAYEAAIAELEKALAELKAAYDEAVADLEAELAELKAAYDKAVDELTAAIDQAIAELTAEIEAQLAELGKIGEELGAILDGIYAEIHDELEAAQAAIEEILKGNLEAIEDLVNALAELGGEAVINVVESIVAQIEAMFEEATTGDYVITPDSYYVAIGDGSAETESYVEELAAYLGIDCNNLAENGQEMADAYDVIAANAEDIAAADLITIGYSNSTFAANAFNAALDGADLDWSTYVTDAGVAYVEDVLAEISAELAANGITDSYNSMAMAAIEAYAYSTVAYACNLPGVVSAIREVNEDAVVIIVGQHNAFAGTTVAFEGVEIDLGEYVDYLVTGAAVYGIAYCMITGDAIYVEAPNADTDMPAEIGMDTLVDFMRGDFSVLYPNATGDLYIRDCILNALNITTAGLLGDANGDGVVNTLDARVIMMYNVGLDVDINLSVCDVNFDGSINTLDARAIMMYNVGLITEFKPL